MVRMPLTSQGNGLSRWRTPLAVVLAILLVAMTAWIVWCEIRATWTVTESFKTKTPRHNEEVSPFQTGVEVYIRRGQSFCFYRGTILRLHLNPKTNRPYTTPTKKNYQRDGLVVVQYIPGLDKSPNGGDMWEEIPVREVYAYPGNTGASRDVCRVFLVDNPPVRWWEQTNTGYTIDAQKYSGANSVQETLMCRPAEYMNTDFASKVPVPAATQPPAQEARFGKPNAAGTSGIVDKGQAAFGKKSTEMEFAGTSALASAKEGGAWLSQNKAAENSINPDAATRKLSAVSNQAKDAGGRTREQVDTKYRHAKTQAKDVGARTREQVDTKYRHAKTRIKDQTSAMAKRLSASFQVSATYVELLNDIMTTVWKNTYVDVRLGQINAAPSVTSDTYHKPVRTGNTHRLYYNTSSGCVSPRLSKISPQSAVLDVHPAACSGTTYELEYGAVSEIHLVGSDEGGHALLMFPQLEKLVIVFMCPLISTSRVKLVLSNLIC